MADSKLLLGEIILMRPICIVCIIIGHVFAAYSGAWMVPNIMQIEYYKYFNPFFISFQLTAFVYISGYLFEYNYIKVQRVNITGYMRKKVKRLLLPCYILSCIYIFFFENNSWSITGFLNGSGHLWFLPMLFWCYLWLILLRKFIGQYIEKKGVTLFVGLLPLSLFLYKLEIPIGISLSFYYLPFMYMGCLFCRNKDVFTKKKLKSLFTIMFVIYILLLLFSFVAHTSSVVLFTVKYLIGISGTLALWSVCFLLKNNIRYFWHDLNKRSFAMYLFHQFIIIYLFYFSKLTSIFSSSLLPFLCLIITFLFLYVLTYLLSFTKVGKSIL